jgi:hypothetical protein
MAECDIGDILCQIKVLQSLNDLKTALGNESFLSRFPELTNLPEKLTTEISNQRGSLREALIKCGNVGLEEESIEAGTGEFEESGEAELEAEED